MQHQRRRFNPPIPCNFQISFRADSWGSFGMQAINAKTLENWLRIWCDKSGKIKSQNGVGLEELSRISAGESEKKGIAGFFRTTNWDMIIKEILLILWSWGQHQERFLLLLLV